MLECKLVGMRTKNGKISVGISRLTDKGIASEFVVVCRTSPQLSVLTFLLIKLKSLETIRMSLYACMYVYICI